MITIIIPYRNRKEHLDIFISKVVPSLQSELKDKFKIMIVEQYDNKPFNRGKLLNIGFNECKYLLTGENDYIILHDVDAIPSSKMIFENYNKSGDIVLLKKPHDYSLGGVCKIKSHIFEQINGHPNTIFGWGVEDRILFYRSKISNHKITFCNQEFEILNHKSNARTYPKELKEYSDYEHNLYLKGQKDEQLKNMKRDGLNTLKYKVVKKDELNEQICKLCVNL